MSVLILNRARGASGNNNNMCWDHTLCSGESLGNLQRLIQKQLACFHGWDREPDGPYLAGLERGSAHGSLSAHTRLPSSRQNGCFPSGPSARPAKRLTPLILV